MCYATQPTERVLYLRKQGPGQTIVRGMLFIGFAQNHPCGCATVNPKQRQGKPLIFSSIDCNMFISSIYFQWIWTFNEVHVKPDQTQQHRGGSTGMATMATALSSLRTICTNLDICRVCIMCYSRNDYQTHTPDIFAVWASITACDFSSPFYSALPYLLAVST